MSTFNVVMGVFGGLILFRLAERGLLFAFFGECALLLLALGVLAFLATIAYHWFQSRFQPWFKPWFKRNGKTVIGLCLLSLVGGPIVPLVYIIVKRRQAVQRWETRQKTVAARACV